MVLSREVDGALVVIRYGGTSEGQLMRALAQLRQGNTNLLGVVLNEADAKADDYGYSKQYYTYAPVEASAEHA
jgi:Mrp family chromosome partitioning ATPase